MKKNVLIFGSISGLIITSLMVYAASACYADPNMETNDVLGYAAMIAAFAFIFVGIRNYRDKYNNGVISFGKAFKTGILMSVVASSIYLMVWLIDYYVFIPDFMDKYTLHVLTDARADGATEKELEAKAAEMAEFSKMYENPLFVVVITFFEIFPVGVAVSLISALFLKKKPGTPSVAVPD